MKAPFYKIYLGPKETEWFVKGHAAGSTGTWTCIQLFVVYGWLVPLAPDEDWAKNRAEKMLNNWNINVVGPPIGRVHGVIKIW